MIHPATPSQPKAVPLPLSETPRPELLKALHNCGPAESANCANIHLALANSYLSSGPLNKTALDNAARELGMAAQNQDLASQILPLRRSVNALLQNITLLQQDKVRIQQSKAQAIAAQNAADAAQARLQRLESLLHQHAEKTLEAHGAPLP
ncbi:hypothetical protein [Acidithiobacillus sulfurivorans]|uniref:Uncharacterized protein n=1 Tax=Acidithiobacillus sulfurivorans TaxID=1958756 RepID=A0ABS5ZZX5_9PROT|nr:hypothetical protein [Acidithiobacillus sulfurivorans]MBU2760234.1 hypothetical protein [Acidithiobacillus sulfurivorans]